MSKHFDWLSANKLKRHHGISSSPKGCDKNMALGSIRSYQLEPVTDLDHLDKEVQEPYRGEGQEHCGVVKCF